jgi:hypothetical protein
MSHELTEKLKIEIKGHTALIDIDNPTANIWDTEGLPAITQWIFKSN